MFCKIFFISLLLLPMISWGQYLSISCDSQYPNEPFVLNRVFTGNTPFLRSYHYDSGEPVDLAGWSMSFSYTYSIYDTNGIAEIPVVVIASNQVDYIGATNIFFCPGDYYFSIKGISPAGYIKTWATGKMIQIYDPATATNLPGMLGELNLSWWSNNVGILVESNRIRIAVFETGKVDLVAFNLTNAIFEGRITTNETTIATLVGYTNYAYLAYSWDDWGTNGLATTNQLNVVSGMVDQAIADGILSSNAWNTTHTAYVAQVDGATNDILSQLNTVLTNQNSTNTLLQEQIDSD